MKQDDDELRMTPEALGSGPAFPVIEADFFDAGMTYREWLVGIIAAGMAASLIQNKHDVAVFATAYADAVIAQLAEEGKP